MSEEMDRNAVGVHIGQALRAVNINLVVAIDEMTKSDPTLADRISSRVQKVIDSNPQLTETAVAQHKYLIDLLEKTEED